MDDLASYFVEERSKVRYVVSIAESLITESLNANGAREKPSTGQPRACRILSVEQQTSHPQLSPIVSEKRNCKKRVQRWMKASHLLAC